MPYILVVRIMMSCLNAFFLFSGTRMDGPPTTASSKQADACRTSSTKIAASVFQTGCLVPPSRPRLLLVAFFFSSRLLACQNAVCVLLPLLAPPSARAETYGRTRMHACMHMLATKGIEEGAGTCMMIILVTGIKEQNAPFPLARPKLTCMHPGTSMHVRTCIHALRTVKKHSSVALHFVRSSMHASV
jgi:hypothetical protein